LHRADGEYRWLLDNGVPIVVPDGGFEGYIGSCVAITELKRAQEENSAKQKLESVGVLAAGIAHDYNNLPGGILAEAELVQEEIRPGSPTIEEVERIKNLATRGSEIVRELMVYAGNEKTNFEHVDL
jgi:two-component system, cell cycle sensor histidine kinase and response regulator CckA